MNSALAALAEKVRRGGPLPFGAGALLGAATPVQRAAMWWRLRGRRAKVDARVISFGNLTAGGTGKTPAVIARARLELEVGRKVAVITRGHGSMRGPEPLARAPGDAEQDMVARFGDEAALIYQQAEGVLLVKGRDRVAAARFAIQAHGCNTLILDDGFQAVALERDENILLVDASNPFGNGRLLPRGVLREPVAAAARATEIILTRCDQAGPTEELEKTLRALCPGVAIRKTRHTPCSLYRIADGAAEPLEMLSGKRVIALCAVARPESFVATLEELGAEVIQTLAFADHAEIPDSAIPSEGLVVTTEKDAVRMGKIAGEVYALGISLQDFLE